MLATQAHPAITGRLLIEVYQWQTCRIGDKCAKEGWGKFLGFAVWAAGEHRAVLRSATREAVELAAIDFCNPALVFQVVGHSCG